jgi:demethylmenaquinone methyltransferase/2-methoxy-6-polyprenyl-1,4-benzoquinol methylase
LKLQPGDIVLELACGTGINFPLYQQYIGPGGRIIGVDITDAMLEQAQKRVDNNGWKNVVLFQQDAVTYRTPLPVNAVISTYALSLFPGPEQVLKNITDSLLPDGRFVLLELQIPPSWPAWLGTAALVLMKPFAVTNEWANQRPWNVIQDTSKNLFNHVKIIERYFSLTYIISGEKAAS